MRESGRWRSRQVQRSVARYSQHRASTAHAALCGLEIQRQSFQTAPALTIPNLEGPIGCVRNRINVRCSTANGVACGHDESTGQESQSRDFTQHVYSPSTLRTGALRTASTNLLNETTRIARMGGCAKRAEYRHPYPGSLRNAVCWRPFLSASPGHFESDAEAP